MKHDLPPDAWACRRCGEPVARALREPFCVPADGCAVVVALAGPVTLPGDTEPFDAA